MPAVVGHLHFDQHVPREELALGLDLLAAANLGDGISTVYVAVRVPGNPQTSDHAEAVIKAMARRARADFHHARACPGDHEDRHRDGGHRRSEHVDAVAQGARGAQKEGR